MIQSILKRVRIPETVNPHWGTTLPLVLALVYFVARIAGTLFVGSLRDEDLSDPTPLTLFWGGIIGSLAMLWLIFQYAGNTSRQQAEVTGEPPRPITDALGYVDNSERPLWLMWLAGLAVIIPLDLIANIIANVDESLPQGLDQMDNASYASWLGALLYFLIMAPLIEQTIFQGMLYPVLARRMDDNLRAVAVTTVPFVLFYLLQLGANVAEWRVLYGGILMPLVLGFSAGIARAYSKSTIGAIGFHISFNLWLILKSYLLFAT